MVRLMAKVMIMVAVIRSSKPTKKIKPVWIRIPRLKGENQGLCGAISCSKIVIDISLSG
jgi:hypothetical protein